MKYFLTPFCILLLVGCGETVVNLDCPNTNIQIAERVPICNSTRLIVVEFDKKNEQLNCELNSSIIPYPENETTCELANLLVHWYEIKSTNDCGELQYLASQDFCM